MLSICRSLPCALMKSPGSGPTCFRRQRHQDGLDIAAGHQAELGAAVVQQVELDVAAAANELMLALGRSPRLVHVFAHDRWIGLEERLADVAREGEVLVEVVLEIIIEDAADAARFVPVREIEVFVAPFLEARIVAGVVRVARPLEGVMEGARVFLVRHHGREIAAAAEPRFRGDDEARIHVHRGHFRRAQVCHQRDARGMEARVLIGAGNLLAKLGAEFAEHGRDVDADLLEDAAAHHRHHAAAAILSLIWAVRLARALPRGALEFAGGRVVVRSCELAFDLLEFGADPVAQAFEPGARDLFARSDVGHERGLNPEVWRRASLNTIDAAKATLSDRAPFWSGTRRRRPAASCTSSGTPALSRPSSSVSDGSKTTSGKVWAPLVVSRTSRPGGRFRQKAVQEACRVIC